MEINRTGADDTPDLPRIFPGDSELAVRMREFDWSSTDLPEQDVLTLCFGPALFDLPERVYSSTLRLAGHFKSLDSLICALAP